MSGTNTPTEISQPEMQTFEGGYPVTMTPKVEMELNGYFFGDMPIDENGSEIDTAPDSDAELDAEHTAYLASKMALAESIRGTREDIVREQSRQASFHGDIRDRRAEDKSNLEFENVNNLVKPAGRKASEIGGKLLRIIEN